MEVDGYPNFYYHTYMANKSKIQFQKGVHPIAKVKLADGSSRIPAIIVSSSPHKYGGESTPWEDIYDPDFGRVKYYGDNKSNATKPDEKPGNVALKNAFHYHSSPSKDERLNNAVPILFFERTSVNGAHKGYLKFHGFGVIESVELITQYDTKTSEGYFSNYVFDMCVFSLTKDNEEFLWDWINARRSNELSNEQTLKYAPKAWKEWIKGGVANLHKVRRHVYCSSVIKPELQKPVSGSKDEKILEKIFEHYEHKRNHFEGFAMRIAQEVFENSGITFIPGWVTQKSSDGGIDFVSRCDIGSDLSRIKMVLVGQAKCESVLSPTNGIDIARTVARLKRGWIGVYVTTSYFSTAVQKEALDDQYPIMLINGLCLSKATQSILYREGLELIDFMNAIDQQYDSLVKNKRPEEILFD